MKQHTPHFISLVDEAKGHIKEITVQDLKNKIDNRDNFKLIDVREDHEWDTGHIETAIHLSKGILERDIEKNIPNLDEEIVVYCSGGFRSALATDNLQKMGYTRVFSLQKGLTDWVNSGFELK